MNIVPFFKITRPFNCLFIGLTVLFGIYFNNPIALNYNIIAGIISAVLIGAAGYIINDFFDIRIDIINKPDRILPSKQMTPKTAYLYAVILFVLGINISFITQKHLAVAIAILNTLLLFFYAKKFKRAFLVGNLLVAYSAGSSFLFGGIIANNLLNSSIVASFAFLYTFIRELVKDMEDVEGDKAEKSTTLAIKLGNLRTTIISFIFSQFILLVAYLSYIKSYVSQTVFILLLLLVYLPMTIFHVIMLKKNNKKTYGLISSLMKIDMLLLLIILWIF